jgi:hypothetical protein
MSINVVVSSTAAGVSVSGGTAVAIAVSSVGASVPVTVGGGIGPAGFVVAPGTSTNSFGTFQLTAGDGITISTSAAQFQIASYGTAAVSSLAPVQSVAGRVGNVVLQASDVTAGTFAIGRIPTISYTALANVPAEFTPAAHTHDAAAISSGTLSIARIPTISYTALSNTPATFDPSAHTHATTDVVAFTAAAAAAAPVQSVQSRTGAIVLTRADITAAAEVHTHSTADIVGFTASASAAAPVQSVAGRTGAISLAAADVAGLASVATSGSYTSLANVPATFAPASHTHDAAAITSGVLELARIPTIGYTALAGVPATFAPSAHTHSTADVVGLTASFSQIGHVHDYAASVHTHSTADIVGYSSLPAQGGAAGPLVTDGTAASWATRYSVVDPVLVQGAGMTLTRDTAAGSITVAFAGGTSGVAVSSATPQPLGTASAGSSGQASRADHVHLMPSAADIGAASAGHSHPYVQVLNGLTGTVSIAGGAGVTVSTASSSITISAGGGGGSANIVEAATAAAFPATGSEGTLYHAIDVKRVYFWDAINGVYVEAGPSGGGGGGGSFVLPEASASVLGGIKVGSGLSISSGVLSATDGVDSLLRSLFVPPAPAIVSGTAGNAQVALTWSAPTVSAQTPVTDYVIQFQPSGGSWQVFSDGTSTATTATVTGLANGTTYAFRVAAVNNVGTGAFSTASAAVTVGVDAFFASVALLLHMDGSGTSFADSSGTTKTISAFGNATQSDTQSKFGGNSLYLDGASHCIAGPYSSFDLAGAFAVECWFYPLAQDATNRSLFHIHTGAPRGLHVSYRNGNLAADNGLAAGVTASGSGLSANSWHHIAVTRSGGTGSTLSLFVDGTRVGQYSSQDLGSTTTLLLGWYQDQISTQRASGYIDDFRLTVGSDRGYTDLSTITVPTEAFQNS